MTVEVSRRGVTPSPWLQTCHGVTRGRRIAIAICFLSRRRQVFSLTRSDATCFTFSFVLKKIKTGTIIIIIGLLYTFTLPAALPIAYIILQQYNSIPYLLLQYAVSITTAIAYCGAARSAGRGFECIIVSLTSTIAVAANGS